jgi:hypothetical protein
MHNCFNSSINGFNITFSRGRASRPGTMRQRKMNSYFIQKDDVSLYGTLKIGQQEYGVEFVLNRSKSSVAYPK